MSPLGQALQVAVGDLKMLRRIVGLEVGLADVVDHIVLLLRDHPGLRNHQPEAPGEGLIHRERVAAVFELARGEPQRRGQRAGPIDRAVAVDAQPLINRLAAFVGFLIEVAQQARMIDVVFVFGDSQAQTAPAAAGVPGRGASRRREFPSGT